MQPLCSRKAISITYSECVFVALHCHLWPARLYSIFPHYFINRTISEEKLLNIKCAFWLSLQLLSETLLILRINVWDIIKNVYWCSCEVPTVLVWNSNFLDSCFKNTQISNFIKIHPVQAKLLHVDKTHMTKLTVTFRNFANTTKKGTLSCSSFNILPFL
jgi:hypothetical protein